MEHDVSSLPAVVDVPAGVRDVEVSGFALNPTHVQAGIIEDGAEALVLFPPPVSWNPLNGSPLDYSTNSGYDNYPYYTYHAEYRELFVMRVVSPGAVLAVYAPAGKTNGATGDLVSFDFRTAFPVYVEIRGADGQLQIGRSCRTPSLAPRARNWLLFGGANADDSEICYDLTPADYTIYTYGRYGPELVPTNPVYWGESSAALDEALAP